MSILIEISENTGLTEEDNLDSLICEWEKTLSNFVNENGRMCGHPLVFTFFKVFSRSDLHTKFKHPQKK